ncbi:tetratricopeptide repeat protein 39B-like [Bolinopsis microptera]|uniref:tetratricopeptide repeat protein 39B-like n=1 Tax=Bolinopsis microptera TaxID=2820187 RepID=UPI003078AA9B
MYAAMAYCNIGFMQAIMTFDRENIAQSLVDIDAAMQVINSYRHKDNMVSYLMSYVKNRDFSTFAELEVHAELLYAETLLVRAILTFAEDQDSLVSFVKGAFKIKTAHSLYKEMYTCLSDRATAIPADNILHKNEIIGGINMGWGAFILGLSLLPPKILRLLEFCGLQGDKMLGHNLVVEAEKMDVLRSFVAAAGLLNYQTIVLQFIKREEYDSNVVDTILSKYLARYPGSVTFGFYDGRREVISGELEKALEKYELCEQSPIDWIQVYHLCYWEKMWCHAMLLQWDQAAHFANRLYKESKWSRTLFGYQYVAFKFMSDSESADLEDIAKLVPKYQLKIGGKHLHIEKFAIRKARSFLRNDKFLCLPGLELLYIWRFIPLMSKESQQKLVKMIEACLEDIANIVPYHTQHPLDDWFLCNLLLAVLTAELGDHEHALSLLRTALQSEDNIQVDHFYIPYAHFELGVLYARKGENIQARAHLRYAKEFSNKVKSYSLENRLLFRIHSTLSEVPEH